MTSLVVIWHILQQDNLIAVVGVHGVAVSQLLADKAEDDDGSDAWQTLCDFTKAVERDGGGQVPLDWNPFRNDKVTKEKLLTLKITSDLHWPKNFEAFGNKYIGSSGHIVTENERNKDNLRPFFDSIIVRAKTGEVPVSHLLYLCTNCASMNNDSV